MIVGVHEKNDIFHNGNYGPTLIGTTPVWFRLVNKLIPGYVKKINTKGGNFALMENIAAVQKGMRQYGVPEDELFQPVDLFEARNIKAVVKSLAALARTVLFSLAFSLHVFDYVSDE